MLCGVLIAIVAGASAGCRETVATPRQSIATASLRLSCERRGDALDCHAIGTRNDEQAGTHSESDLTNVAAWSTSNPDAVDILHGRATAKQPGIATIAASVRSGEETLSSSTQVVVTKERPYPQLAYDLAGVVRDPTNSGLKDVELTLMADREPVADASRKTGTVSDGAFHFAPLLSGQYRLRATKQGYRPVEKQVTVPDTTPLTVVLISEAR
jgi:Carboxypeptidase regulatory-like domain